MKPVTLRPLAERDLLAQARHYRTVADLGIATRFFNAAVAALRRIEEMPGVGSPRVGELIDVPGLRRIGIQGFPCGWLYLERPETLDVIRLLSERQDLAVLLDEPE